MMNATLYSRHPKPLSKQTLITLLIAIAISGILAAYVKPEINSASSSPSLEAKVPRQFGDWAEVEQRTVPVSLLAGETPDLNQPYDQIVTRTYSNSKGVAVMLALAWGKNQRQEVKIHRPDLCYVAQGHKISLLRSHTFSDIRSPSGVAVTGKQMQTTSSSGLEYVSYWMRIGSLYSEDAIQTRIHILSEGLSGRIPDGILVRASLRPSDKMPNEEAWKLLDDFLLSLTKGVPSDALFMLLR